MPIVAILISVVFAIICGSSHPIIALALTFVLFLLAMSGIPGLIASIIIVILAVIFMKDK